MILALTALGLILVPFYDLLFRIFPNVVVLSESTRPQREIIALALALAIGLSALYQGRLKPFRNIWIILLVVLQIVIVSIMPKVPFIINSIDNSGFWVWKPMFQLLSFLLMGAAISSVNFTKKDLILLIKIIYYCGLVMSGYVILQTIGMDQFFKQKSLDQIGAVLFANRVGTLGQPTLVAAFIAMTIPMAFYLRKYVQSIIMIISVCLTHSQFSFGALALGIVTYIIMLKPSSIYILIPICILLFSIFIVRTWPIQDNGRFSAWNQTFKDIRETPLNNYKGSDFSLFGNGLGSFPYLSTTREESKFAQVHNEYLELWYNCGIFGLLLFILSIKYIFKQAIAKFRYYADYRKRLIVMLICSLLIISLNAFGTFVWQLGAHVFYTVTIVGILLNSNIGERKWLES